MNRANRIRGTLPLDLAAYLGQYRREHGLASRSAALAAAVRALRDRELEAAYRELGEAQRQGLESYPPDNADGLGEA